MAADSFLWESQEMDGAIIFTYHILVYLVGKHKPGISTDLSTPH